MAIVKCKLTAAKVRKTPWLQLCCKFRTWD